MLQIISRFMIYHVIHVILEGFAFTLDSVLKKYPSKFVGCCLANPAEDGSGVKQLEDLVLKVFWRLLTLSDNQCFVSEESF